MSVFGKSWTKLIVVHWSSDVAPNLALFCRSRERPSCSSCDWSIAKKFCYKHRIQKNVCKISARLTITARSRRCRLLEKVPKFKRVDPTILVIFVPFCLIGQVELSNLALVQRPRVSSGGVRLAAPNHHLFFYYWRSRDPDYDESQKTFRRDDHYTLCWSRLENVIATQMELFRFIVFSFSQEKVDASSFVDFLQLGHEQQDAQEFGKKFRLVIFKANGRA